MRLRTVSVFVAAAIVAACGHDSTSPGTGGGSTNSNGYTIVVDSAFTGRTAVVGSTLPAEVHVTLNGQPASGITVTWTAETGSGTVTPTSSTTNSAGVASATWTISDTARANTLAAGITGASTSMQATGTAGPATTVVKVSPDSSAVVAGASTLLTARVNDRFGNAVSGATVTWSASGGVLNPTSTTTGVSGQSNVAFTTGAQTAYSVTATVAGIGAVTFKVVGL